LLYLACHALAIVLLPAQAMALSLGFLTLAPFRAGIACFRRASAAAESEGWIAIGLAMMLWSGGMASTMLGALALGTLGGVDGLSIMLFMLYGVPLLFAAASPERELWYVRVVDGALALVLGYLFFRHSFAFATMTGASAEGVLSLRLMLDIENLFIALFSLTRFVTSADPGKRALFGTLTIFAFVYMVAAGYINHLQSDTDYGTPVDLVIELPFLLLAVLALRHAPGPRAPSRAARRTAHLVRAGSPLMLAATLLAVSALLLPREPGLAIAGLITATLGTGIRSVLVQARSFQEHDRLDELSRIDGLTGLPNRRQFDDVLRREWNRARRSGGGLALLMIDIDHFKLLNDNLGHPVGDERLREVGRTLTGCATRGGDLIARYGGEEFAAILPATGAVEAAALAEAMRAAIAGLRLPSPAEGGFVTISIGVGAVEDIRADTADALLALADAALYAAKKSGRNRVVNQAFPAQETA
jgi:diguanylate cyclase (GGDEF)-like protein